MTELQLEMRQAYSNGFPGVVISGLVWLAAGLASHFHADLSAMACLFVGGMLIHPVATAVSKYIFNGSPVDKSNPLNLLALESTVLLFVGLFIAYAVSYHNTRLFFSTMLMIIGARYLVFQSLYGLKIYWILGVVLIAVGILLSIVFNDLSAFITCYIGGGVEILFGITGLTKTPIHNAV